MTFRYAFKTLKIINFKGYPFKILYNILRKNHLDILLKFFKNPRQRIFRYPLKIHLKGPLDILKKYFKNQRERTFRSHFRIL